MDDNSAKRGAQETGEPALISPAGAPAGALPIENTHAPKPPRVSVLMAAHNAAPYLRQAILSILGQSFTDFELIVVDDASTDATAAIAASLSDPRLRLVASPVNVGAAQARNLGFALARGSYLAIQDADDISHPTRLARQVEHLDRNSADVLVASDIRQLHPGGEMIQPRTGGPASPLLLDWMLHLGNPIGFSSVMMRISTLRRLPEFLREQRRYAEDYDLYARLLAHGGLTRLPQPLLIYRVHPGSCSALNHAGMVEQTGRVLGDIWARDRLGVGDSGGDSAQAAGLIARHIAAGMIADNPRVLRAVRDALSRLTDGFLARHPECTPAEREAVVRHAIRLWEGLVRASLRAGTVTWPSVPFFRTGTAARLRSRDLLGAALQGMVPRRIVDLLRPRPAAFAQPQPPPLGGPQDGPVGDSQVGDGPWGGFDAGSTAPPVLFVAVVLQGVAAGTSAEARRPDAAFALGAQAIFDRYGVRPAYLLDEALAAQDPVCLALRNVDDGGGCGIGAWWHPGTSPARVNTLLSAIEGRCGVAPCFTTTEAAAMIPAVTGMGDRVARLVAIPLSRGMIVPLAQALSGVRGSAMSQSDSGWVAPPDRGELAHPVALLPDEIASEPQIILIRTMLARAERRFFVRLHLRQGDARSGAALDRLARVCAWFFEDLGGLPGDVRTLAADRRRRRRGPRPGAGPTAGLDSAGVMAAGSHQSIA